MTKSNSPTSQPSGACITVAPVTKKSSPIQVGSKVAILQNKHLKCSNFGFVQYIDGGYIHVRPESFAVVESDACERTFELYSGEIKFVENYEHQSFPLGTVVRIKKLEWHNVSAKTHGIVIGVEAERILVQPIGAHKGAIISALPEYLKTEANELHQQAQSVAIQSAICSLLKALGSTAISHLQTLLSTQPGLCNELETNLARLANEGKIYLSESQAAPKIIQSRDAEAFELEAAQANLAEAEARLAGAIRQVILNG